MKYKLIKPINPKLTVKQQIAWNRGIDPIDYDEFINVNSKSLISEDLLGVENLQEAGRLLKNALDNKQRVGIVVDCDCDGYLSSALLLNYLYDLDHEWCKNCVEYYIHMDKTHGISDAMDFLETGNYSLVIIPDASSSEWELHQTLKEFGINVIVLDHHKVEAKDIENSPAIIINNQASEYKNKDFCGAGIVYKFCKYFDRRYGYSYADKYLDMVAVANIADMMDMRSLETKYLINTGLKNIKNPFIDGMRKKNSYSIGSTLTPISVAFYIAPFVNAMTRSGKPDEQDILFRSMVTHKAYELIPSTKVKHKGEEETVLEQALRVATNVKARQKRTQDSTLKYLEETIEREHLDEDNAIVLTVPKFRVDKNLAGLCANQIMAKYRKPVCVMMDREDEFAGSARGCDRAGITNFKEICEKTGATEYCMGHNQAFGICVKKSAISLFKNNLFNELNGIDKEAHYDVDFIYKSTNFKGANILDIAEFEDSWGTGFPESKVAIEDLIISKSMINVYENKTTTLKITLGNGVELMKFMVKPDVLEKFQETPIFKLSIVGTPHINSWNGIKRPQIFIEDFEISPYW